jgi:hypothetical protein
MCKHLTNGVTFTLQIRVWSCYLRSATVYVFWAFTAAATSLMLPCTHLWLTANGVHSHTWGAMVWTSLGQRAWTTAQGIIMGLHIDPTHAVAQGAAAAVVAPVAQMQAGSLHWARVGLIPYLERLEGMALCHLTLVVAQPCRPALYRQYVMPFLSSTHVLNGLR